MKVFLQPASRGRGSIREGLLKLFFLANGLVSIIVLILIFAFIFGEGLPAIQERGILEFLIGTRWNPTSYVHVSFGTVPLMLGTAMVTVIAMVIAVPWGIGSAAYISEAAHPKIREIIKPVIEILAILPSVVIGFIALVIVAPAIAKIFGLSSGLTALTGGLMLSLMALPTIVSIAEDAIHAVPQQYREASYALGATKWQTIRHTVIPTALSGIIASVMLGMGRAIGETMTVLMATGNVLKMPITELFGIPLPDFLAPIRTMTATIVIEGLETPAGSLHWHALFVVGTILFLITFAINLVADIILHRYMEVAE